MAFRKVNDGFFFLTKGRKKKETQMHRIAGVKTKKTHQSVPEGHPGNKGLTPREDNEYWSQWESLRPQHSAAAG